MNLQVARGVRSLIQLQEEFLDRIPVAGRRYALAGDGSCRRDRRSYSDALLQPENLRIQLPQLTAQYILPAFEGRKLATLRLADRRRDGFRDFLAESGLTLIQSPMQPGSYYARGTEGQQQQHQQAAQNGGYCIYTPRHGYPGPGCVRLVTTPRADPSAANAVRKHPGRPRRPFRRLR